MDFKKIALAAAVGLVGLALYLAWLWQPARQVQRHTAQFLKAVERGNWDKVSTMVADDYADRWDHDKDFVVNSGRDVFRQFAFLEIQNEPSQPTLTGREGSLYTPIKISGQGGPVAQFVMQKVNELGQPFTFTWRRSGKMPWEWQLTRIDHPVLEISRDVGF